MKVIMLSESEVAWMEAETPQEEAWIESHKEGGWGAMVCAWAREQRRQSKPHETQRCQSPS